jgi:hypothetical protein
MKQFGVVYLALVCAGAVTASAAAETTAKSSRANHHARSAPQHFIGSIAPTTAARPSNDLTVPPFSWLTRLFPNVKPYPPGQGNADGRSRNPEDCNKGCIGITPR